MVQLRDLVRVSDFVWEIPATFREDMRVPARVYTSESMLADTLKDQSLEQLVNATTLPGVVRHTIAMPDVHQGYGFPVGGVAAMQLPDGVISPGAIGYDINCGVRLLATELDASEAAPFMEKLAATLYQTCPSGVGQGGRFQLSDDELTRVLRDGAQWCRSKGLATDDDLRHTEEQGHMPGADPAEVSTHARERARGQLGTLGAGNHFLEVDEVVAIHDGPAADAFGLRRGQLVVQIHCGSRGLGHQICTDYVREFQGVVKRYGIVLPDRELVCAPLDSPEGRRYLAAMQCAVNFAFANRQALTALVRESFERVFRGSGLPFAIRQVYDVAHNIAKIEEHTIDGQHMTLCVHRKGATRAFGPGSPAIPADYRAVGQPVLVPGSMGTASYVLAGTAGAMAQTFGSSCHGAGRLLSRTAAKKRVQGAEVRRRLQEQGIHVHAGSMAGLAEEAPLAYKPVDQVVEVVERAGIARIVAQLAPRAVVKG
ncbi:MAG TPA: RtcB family protein [Roseiflexaceae bacterium]|nr:RtcB family protein [Roseiflexaceae bacterium]